MFAPIAAERQLKIYLISEHYTRHVQPRRGLTARLGRPPSREPFLALTPRRCGPLAPFQGERARHRVGSSQRAFSPLCNYD
jgi:hypothetical protein